MCSARLAELQGIARKDKSKIRQAQADMVATLCFFLARGRLLPRDLRPLRRHTVIMSVELELLAPGLSVIIEEAARRTSQLGRVKAGCRAQSVSFSRSISQVSCAKLRLMKGKGEGRKANISVNGPAG